jgi:hypothetical protein
LRDPLGSLAQQAHHRSLQNRIHSRRELIHENDGRIDHEHLGHLHASPEPPTEIHDLAADLGLQAELLDYPACAPSQVGAPQAVKSAERDQVVSHVEKQLGGALLDHDRNALTHVEPVAHDVEATHAGLTSGRTEQRRQNPECGRLPCSVRPSKPKIDPGETENVRPSTARLAPAHAAYRSSRARQRLWQRPASRRPDLEQNSRGPKRLV